MIRSPSARTTASGTSILVRPSMPQPSPTGRPEPSADMVAWRGQLGVLSAWFTAPLFWWLYARRRACGSRPAQSVCGVGRAALVRRLARVAARRRVGRAWALSSAELCTWTTARAGPLCCLGRTPGPRRRERTPHERRRVRFGRRPRLRRRRRACLRNERLDAPRRRRERVLLRRAAGVGPRGRADEGTEARARLRRRAARALADALRRPRSGPVRRRAPVPALEPDSSGG
mmetsp:Transcript_2262/g.6690  ORF Transcript_2262/g.6690 Transcript_2262/m.6690 type:complete len:231 (-) Transcript_2262:602-1294(-)